MARQKFDYKGSYEEAREALLIKTTDQAISLWLEPQRVEEAFDWLAKWFLPGPKFSVTWAVESVVASVGSSNVLKYFEGVNLCGLPQRVSFVRLLRNPFIPLYSLEELADLTEALIPYLMVNRKSILQSGQPESKYDPPLWFYMLLTWLYRLKLPFDPESTRNEGWDDVISYEWALQTGDEIVFPPRVSSQIRTVVDESVSRKAADRAGRLPSGYIAGWEAARPKLFDLKMSILKELLHALRSRTAVSLWRNCLMLLREQLKPHEVDFLLRLDQVYTGFDVRTGKRENDGMDLFIGGLTELLLVIGHYEKEIVVGTFARIRDTLGDLVKPDQQNLPRLIAEHYLEVMGLPERKILDAAFDLLPDIERQEEAFWEEYRTRINETVGKRSKVTLEIEPEFKLYITSFYEWAKAHREVSGRLPELEVAEPARPRSKRIARFPPLKGLRWDEVSMGFVSNDALRIQARGISKTYNFAEIGFKDGRRSDRPNSRWGILKDGFAKYDGELSWKTDLPKKTQDRLKATVKDIRKLLKTIMQIDDDPFYPYREVHAYKTRFELRDDTPDNNASY